MKFKTIIFTILLIFLFWIIIKYGTYVCEGFEEYSHMIIPYPKDALIDYNDLNSPLYSHTVNLPINDTKSCKNFCGPKSQCLLTREQCTSDIDCYGCNPGKTPQNECIAKDVPPHDGAGIQGKYSTLLNKENINYAEIYPGSKDRVVKQGYQGEDLWTKSFNYGLELYNKKREVAEKYNIYDLDFGFQSKKQYYEPKYPMTISATGLFYETTPPASNASLNK